MAEKLIKKLKNNITNFLQLDKIIKCIHANSRNSCFTQQTKIRILAAKNHLEHSRLRSVRCCCMMSYWIRFSVVELKKLLLQLGSCCWIIFLTKILLNKINFIQYQNISSISIRALQ